MVKVVCEQCGKEFKVFPGRVGKAKFCSRACMGQWRHQNLSGENAPRWAGGEVKRNCLQCDRGFTTKPSRVEGGKGKFCSPACHCQWRSENVKGPDHPRWTRVKGTCEQCGKKFWTKPSKLKQGYGRFCSHECQAKWQSQARRGQNSSRWKGGKIERICEWCGKEFKVWTSQGAGRFCSNECYHHWFVGENCPRWQGGMSFEPYPFEFNDALKRAVRDRDGHICAICKLPEGDRADDIHHIDYDKDNSQELNLLELCNKCHAVVNIDREYWQKVLTPLPKLHTLPDLGVSPRCRP